MCAVLYVRVHACRCVCVYVCAYWMCVGQCMGSNMHAYQPRCMRMHACDYVWRVIVCMDVCVCVFVCPHAYAQMGVNESDCVFECVCACVSTHENACVW